MEPVRLFSEYDLNRVFDTQRKKISQDVAAVPVERLTDQTFEKLVYEIAEPIRVSRLEIREDDVSYETAEAKVDVSQDSRRAISNRSRPFYIDGVKVTYFVPFNGDAALLRCQPSSFTTIWPYAVINEGELSFEFSVTDGDILSTKPRFKKELELVKQYAGWVNTEVDTFNASLSGSVGPVLANRLRLLKTSKEQAADLGFKVRERPPDRPEPTQTQTSQAAANRPAGADRTLTTKHREYDVALSFAGENREYVDQVANRLKKTGVRVFYDRFETVDLWGRNLIDHLGRVYSEQSRFIVMFVSEHYAVRSWPNHERKSAQDRAVKMKEDCILPVRFDDTELPGMPSSIGFIDARVVPPDDLSDLITAKIKGT